MKTENLKYHQETMDLIGEDPSFSAINLKLLQKLEQETGIPLPASIKEWYSLEKAVEILADYSNTDHVTPVEELGKEKIFRRRGIEYKYNFLLEQNLLPVLLETQSVWSWAIKLDGSADPPVFTCAGSPEPESKWVLCADSFSTFVYSRARDFKDWFGEYYVWSYDEEKLEPEILTFLTSHFTTGPQTFSYGCTNLRFYSGTKYLHLFLEENQTTWEISAGNYEDLLELCQLLWNCGNLANTLEADDDTPASSVLQVLRNATS